MKKNLHKKLSDAASSILECHEYISVLDEHEKAIEFLVLCQQMAFSMIEFGFA